MFYAIAIGLTALLGLAAYLLAEWISPLEALRRLLALRSRGR